MTTAPTFSNLQGLGQSYIGTQVITTTGSPLFIPLPQEYTAITLRNLSNVGQSPATPTMVQAYWNNYMSQGTAIVYQNVSSTTTLQSVLATANTGISQFNTASPILYPVITGGTTITNANPAVASIPLASTNFVAGQTVRLTNVVGAPQLNGYIFTISNVTATTFTIPYLDMSGFAAGATSFNAQVVQAPTLLTYPANNFITKILQGTTTTIQLAYTHNFFVGQAPGGGSGQVFLTIPTQYGAQGLNKAGYGDPQPWTITAINGALPNSITINADSSALQPFAFPTSATWSTTKPSIPQVTPFGQTPYNYKNASAQTSQWIMVLGSAVCGTGVGTIFADLFGSDIIGTYPAQIPS